MVTTNGRIPLSLEGIERVLAQPGTVEDRRAYMASLRKRIAHYERQYELPSEELRKALASQEVRENLDTVKWSFAYETLRELENGRQARLERSERLSPRRVASGGR
jgi:phage shock protein A